METGKVSLEAKKPQQGGGKPVLTSGLYFWVFCSRAATKFSRSMAVTTPNTICCLLDMPLLRSREKKQLLD